MDFTINFMIVSSWTSYYFKINTGHFLQLNLTFLDTRSYEDIITWFICVLLLIYINIIV